MFLQNFSDVRAIQILNVHVPHVQVQQNTLAYSKLLDRLLQMTATSIISS